ncbi:ABC transporter substrate-binding protein [Pseudaquidulcibacter saccharophilus]|uniref:ABC transporter substrate-binding protein n=1 Tax=Pseudaquidulcibacter saccharophilus TaxID=2831900 RepID=UPI001EFF2D84|nr:ABC transporter substrate-binding protein [Pseudaquidulcibacter saccharophilus]
MNKAHIFLFALITPVIFGGCNKPHVESSGGITALPYRPRNIVSINPCADAILMEVADKSQIKAISHYSHEKTASSIDLNLAKQFPATFDTAEEVINFKPDLVIAGSHVAPPTVAALERLKIPVLNLGVPQSIEESKAQITLVANITHNANNGVLLNKKIDAAVKNAKSDKQIPALIWQANGLSPGEGTLADELLKIAGFKNKSSEYGVGMWGIVSLEPLIANPPKYLMTKMDADGSDTILTHPVLKKLSGKSKIVDFRPRYLTCAGPVMIDALGRLKQIRDENEK